MTDPRLESRPDTREADAASVLLGVLPEFPANHRVLVVDDHGGSILDHLQRGGQLPTAWLRVCANKRTASDWPAAGPYSAATLRMPTDKEHLHFVLEAIGPQLEAGAPIFVYGANDEGIRSVGSRLERRFEQIETLDTRKHCRVVRAVRPTTWDNAATGPDSLAKTVRLTLPWGELEHTVYPGIFAKGGFDPGTRLLLENLPQLDEGSRVLDYACGSGVIGAALRLRQPGLKLNLQLFDADALAVRAARKNVPGAQVAMGESWGSLPTYQRYNLIASNPPIHVGKARSYKVLQRLVEGAPARLANKGSLHLVIQSQVPVRGLLDEHFDDVSETANDGRFRVWRCGRLKDRGVATEDRD